MAALVGAVVGHFFVIPGLNFFHKNQQSAADANVELLAQLSSTETILDGLNRLPEKASLLYVMVPGSPKYPTYKRLWHFNIKGGERQLDCETDDGQFFDERIQAKLKELGIGYEKGMTGGYLALPEEVTLPADPNAPRIPCKLWPDGKITTTMPGAKPRTII